MIKIIFFTSGKYTQALVKTLRQSKDSNLIKVYRKLPATEPVAKADLFLVADFGEIIPPNILSLPKYGALCLHPSLLPKYRGASPVPTAIINNEKETGLTIFKMGKLVDHGPIISQLRENILPNDTSESLYIRLFTLGAQRLQKVLPDYLRGKINPQPQNHNLATFTKKLVRDDGKIDRQKTSAYQEKFIRAMSPWPGAWTEVELSPGTKRRLKILKAHLEKSKLIFDQVQLEGKKPVSFKQFKEGYPLTTGLFLT